MYASAPWTSSNRRDEEARPSYQSLATGIRPLERSATDSAIIFPSSSAGPSNATYAAATSAARPPLPLARGASAVIVSSDGSSALHVGTAESIVGGSQMHQRNVSAAASAADPTEEMASLVSTAPASPLGGAGLGAPPHIVRDRARGDTAAVASVVAHMRTASPNVLHTAAGGVETDSAERYNHESGRHSPIVGLPAEGTPAHQSIDAHPHPIPPTAAATVANRGDRFLSMSPESILGTVWHRLSILISLLLLQSLSQLILERYESLLSDHVIVPLFLTMLVGAGGNAGNQSAVRSITGLVSGEFRMRDFGRVVRKEITVGLINSAILATIGFSRVYYFYGHRNLFWSTLAITASLFCIVFSSVILGTSLPFALGRLGYDKEHAAPIIQVVMDITGVFITCVLCNAIIPDSEHTTKAEGGS